MTIQLADDSDATSDRPAWFITFCLSDPRADNYAILRSQDYGDARQEAFARFGKDWAFMYNIEDLQPQIAAFGLTELEEERPDYLKIAEQYLPNAPKWCDDTAD